MDMHRFVVLKILKNRELSEIYAMMSLRVMAMSLISIFIPIYLYTLGYGIPAIILFFITISATHALLCPVSAKISSKIGLKHGMMLSFLGYFIFYAMLTMLGTNSQLLFLSALTYGASQALFWVPFHALFPMFTDGKKRGEEVALLHIFPALFSVMAPVIGGLVIFFFGFNVLFAVGLAFLMAAALPLLVSREIYAGFSFTKHVEGFDRNVAVSLMSGYSYTISENFWPIFIFIVVGSAAVIGGIVSFATAIGFVTIWIVGKLCDRGYRKKLLELGSVAQSVLWIFRALVSTFAHIISLESVWRFFAKFADVPYDSAYYERARKSKKRLEFATLREMMIHGTIVFVFGLMFMLYAYIPNMAVLFLVAAVGPLLGVFIERR